MREKIFKQNRITIFHVYYLVHASFQSKIVLCLNILQLKSAIILAIGTFKYMIALFYCEK